MACASNRGSIAFLKPFSLFEHSRICQQAELKQRLLQAENAVSTSKDTQAKNSHKDLERIGQFLKEEKAKVADLNASEKKVRSKARLSFSVITLLTHSHVLAWADWTVVTAPGRDRSAQSLNRIIY